MWDLLTGNIVLGFVRISDCLYKFIIKITDIIDQQLLQYRFLTLTFYNTKEYLLAIIPCCEQQKQYFISRRTNHQRQFIKKGMSFQTIVDNNQWIIMEFGMLIAQLKNMMRIYINTQNYNTTKQQLQNLTLFKMTQSDCVDFIKVLKNWQVQESKAISSVLTRMGLVKTFPAAELQVLFKILIKFHKEIIKAPDGEVDPKWFQHVIKLKPKLQKMIEQSKKAKPELVKRPSQIIDYPQSLTSGRGPTEQKILRTMFKNFVNNLQESATNPNTVSFLQNGLRQLKLIFQDKPEESLYKRVNSICNRLGRLSSKQAKQKMLRGQITPKQLAIDNEKIYFDERTKETLRKNQMALIQESMTGYYEQMKRKINKDACEQCRFCHQNQAFCEDMKQTRASDQPMTRFMRCNNCNKGWRD